MTRDIFQTVKNGLISAYTDRPGGYSKHVHMVDPGSASALESVDEMLEFEGVGIPSHIRLLNFKLLVCRKRGY